MVAKDERHAIFARFIAAELGPLHGKGRVIDVAGGKGHLSAAMIELGLACTLVDPCAERGRNLMCDGLFPTETGSSSACDALVDDGRPLMVVRKTLQEFLESDRACVAACSAIVGLHPDEATEDIVTAALGHERPFAVVPCCVLPQLFPERRLGRNGVRVKKHGAFVEYLLAKDWRLRSAKLPRMGGRDVVIFMSAEDYLRPSKPPPPPNYGPCTEAARSGDLGLLRELHMNGSPWNTEMLQKAAWCGHLHILEYAREHEHPWSDRIYPDGWQAIAMAAESAGHDDIVRWVQRLAPDGDAAVARNSSAAPAE